MAEILLVKSATDDVRRELKKMSTESEQAAKKICSAIKGLDFEVASKENIRRCMKGLNESLKKTD